MPATTWNIDVAHSAIHFHVRHMVISKVHGRFAKWSGALTLDPQNPTTGSVKVQIDAASIDTQVGDRDAHLRSADFLDVARFPEIAFASRSVKPTADGLAITGDLSLHGVTREVVLQAEFSGTGKDPWGNQRAGFSAKAGLDRRDFGLVWNAALEAGGVLVGEKVEITIELEAIQQAAAQAA